MVTGPPEVLAVNKKPTGILLSSKAAKNLPRSCNDGGKVIHEGILSRLGEEEFMLFGRGCFWADYKLLHGHYDATSKADDWFNFQVSGPNAVSVGWKRRPGRASGHPLHAFRQDTHRRARGLGFAARHGGRNRL